MIPTEEQRAAICAVSGLLTAIGCPQCHSYLQKNYTHHIEVLRAMIDGSEQFSDASKMIGFDLERARGLRDFLQDDCAEVGDVWAEMIAEIERLRASLIDLHAEYINTLEKNPECSAWDLDEQSDADQKRLRRNAAHAISIAEPPIYLQAEQRATKIKELEDAHKRSGKKYAKIINELRSSVYANIPGLDVGKIGPDAAKPHCWQITDEQKAALGVILARIEYDQSLPGRFNYTVSRAKDTLRAMLEEAQP